MKNETSRPGEAFRSAEFFGEIFVIPRPRLAFAPLNDYPAVGILGEGKEVFPVFVASHSFPAFLFDAEVGHIWDDIAKFCIGVISELPLPADWSLLLTANRPFKVNLQHFHLSGYLVSWKEWCPEV